MSALLTEAQRLTAAGFSVIPVKRDKRPALRSWTAQQQTIPTASALAEMFSHPDVTGVAVVGGAVSGGLVVFDFDRDDDGEAVEPFDLGAEFVDLWLELLQAEGVIDPATIPQQRTGGGGRQLAVRCPEPCGNKKLAEVPAKNKQGFISVIETRGTGGYALAPPSLHPSGGTYAWEHLSLDDVPTVTPEQLEKMLECARALDRMGLSAAEEKNLVSTYKPPPPREGQTDVIGAFNQAHSPAELLEQHGYIRRGAKYISPDSKSGNAGVTLLDGGRLVYSHHGDALGDGDPHDAFDVFALLEHGGDKKAARQAAARALGLWDEPTPRRRAQEPTPNAPDLTAFARTDYGNAERLHARYGHTFRYCGALGWLVWDGRRWRPDEDHTVMERLALETARELFNQAAGIADNDQRAGWVKHSLTCERSGALKNAVDLARTIPGVTVKADALDADLMRLNLLSGTLDLRTGRQEPHRPADLITKLAPVTYDAAAAAPVWTAFQRTICAADADLIAFKRRAFGYTLTGTTSEDVLFIAYGSGSNGKSTELETIGGILGDYGNTAQFETFAVKKSEGVRNDLADLMGARFVSASEGENRQRFAEGLVKQLTGGDVVKARFLHKEYFRFRPAFKLWLATNHKPVIRGTDHGIWRRVRLIPYAVTIAPEQRDKHLREKLERERSGILNWLLQGCREWLADGLGDAEAVLKATAEYRRESDALADFIEARCAIGEDLTANAGDLYRAYETWCGGTGEHPFSATLFGRMLTERGFGSSQTRLEGRVTKLRTGIRLEEVVQKGVL